MARRSRAALAVRTALAAALAAGQGLVGAENASSLEGTACDVAAAAPPAGVNAAADSRVVRAAAAFGRGVFVTYSDTDTIIDGGTLAPPDLAAPLAAASVDRTGLGSALAGPAYSPYNDAAGVLNAFAGTQLPVDGISEPSRAKVTGRPPQDRQLALPGAAGSQACARLLPGPAARAAVVAASVGSGFAVRVGDVVAVAGPRGRASSSEVRVVLSDVTVADLYLQTVTLTARALADGKAGDGEASTVVSGVRLAGQPMRLTSAGLEPAGTAAPVAAALAAAGIELVSAGSVRHEASGGSSSAYAAGPTLRYTSPDGRVLTVVLGEATATAQRDRTG